MREAPVAESLVVISTYDATHLEELVVGVLNQGEFDALIVDVGSSPERTQLAETFAEMYPGRVSRLPLPSAPGPGAATVAGLRWGTRCGYRYLFQIEANFVYSPSSLVALREAIIGADVVIGSRYVHGGQVVHAAPWRKWLSRSGSRLARVLLGVPITDWTGGLCAYRRESLAGLPLDAVTATGFAAQLQLLDHLYRRQARIREIPVSFAADSARQPRLTVATLVEAARCLLALWLARANAWLGEKLGEKGKNEGGAPMRTTSTALLFVLTAVVAITFVGTIVGYSVAMQTSPRSPAELSASHADRAEGLLAKADPGVGTGDPRTVATPVPVTDPAPGNIPELAGIVPGLTEVDFDGAQRGVQVTLMLHNATDKALETVFEPQRHLQLVDERGRRYDLRWAEFDGVLRAGPGATVRLARAFFTGELSTSRRLTLQLTGVTGLSDTTWGIDGPAAIPATTLDVGEPLAHDGLVTSVADVVPRPSLGGVEVTIRVQSRRAAPVRFSFDPQSNIRVADATGRRFDLRWAEYAGQTEITPNAATQLVRAFFSGPVDATPKLRIEVGGIPWLGSAAWTVPVHPTGAGQARAP